MIKLGPQLYTVRDYTQTLEGIDKTFAICEENRYETVQISGFGPVPFDGLYDLIQKHHISVACTHSPLDRMRNDLDALIEEHKRMNCPVIGLGAMPGEYRESEEGIERFIREISPIAKKIKQSGLQFAYHNHNFEFAKVNGRTLMDRLVKETDPDEFHFIPDTFWLQMGGVNPSAFLRRNLKGRVEVCHFKDFAVEDGKPVFAEVGEGNLDLLDCFRACREIGVQAIVIEEDICPRDPFDCLKHSYDNLMQLAHEAGDR